MLSEHGLAVSVVQFSIFEAIRNVRSAGQRQARDAEGTKKAIFAAAIRHFAAFGYEGAHVRKMLADAGVNMSLAHYYFGSKEALYRAVLDHFIEPVVVERRKGLSEWKKVRASDQHALVELLTAYVLPHFLVSASEDGHMYARLMQRELASGGRVETLSVPQIHLIRRAYMAELENLVPGLDAQAATFVMNALVSVMLSESLVMAVQNDGCADQAHLQAGRVARLIANGVQALIDQQ